LLTQEPVPGGFEIIVADGMSQDGTRRILEELARLDSRLRIVDNAGKITPSGMNDGIRVSQGEWVAIVGAHARYAPDYLVRCLEVARRTGAENVGGGMFCEGEQSIQRAIAAAHHSPFSAGGARWHNPNYEGPADTVFGGFYRREVFMRIGLFDEQLVRNQDDELNFRLSRAGGRIWQSPLVKSWYQPRSSLWSLFRQYMQYGYWKVRVIQKHRVPASWRHLAPGTFVLATTLMSRLGIVCFLAALWGAWPLGPALVCILGAALCLGAYFATCLAASLLTARTHGWSILPVLPLVFICYHWGYGYGFLWGVWDFLVWNKQPGDHFVQLTRLGAAKAGVAQND
jgi:glycosyltransferase involved in cell wall biosynthesis